MFFAGRRVWRPRPAWIRRIPPEGAVVGSSAGIVVAIAMGILLKLAGVHQFFFALDSFLFLVFAGVALVGLIGIACRPSEWKANISYGVVAASITLLIVATFSFPNQDLNGGRDQGSNVLYAVALLSSPSLLLSGPEYPDAFLFFHGSGESLGFGKLPGFPVALALAGKFFGLSAMWRVNGLLLLLSAAQAFVVLRGRGQATAAKAMLALISTSYILVWFGKSQDDNILALFLLVTAVVHLERFRENGRPFPAIIVGSSGFVMCFSRPEGPAFAGIWFALLIGTAIVRLKENAKDVPTLLSVALGCSGLLGGAAVFGLFLRLHQPEWFESAGFLYLRQAVLQLLGRHPLDQGLIGPEPRPNWNDYKFRYVWDVFSTYALTPLITFSGLAALALRKAVGRWIRPALMFSPGVLFLVHPAVSVYHPWFMRHYASYTILPLLVGTAIFFGKSRNSLVISGRFKALAASLLVLVGATASSHIFVRSENFGVESITSELAMFEPRAVIAEYNSGYSGEKFFDFSTATYFLLKVSTVPVAYNLDPEKPFAPNIKAAVSDADGRAFVVAANKNENLPNGKFPFFLDTQLRLEKTLRVTATSIEEEQLYRYVNNPPLRQGYEPFRDSLRRLPHSSFTAHEFEVFIYRVLDGSRVLENVTFGSPTSWSFEEASLSTRRASFAFFYKDYSFGQAPLPPGRVLERPLDVCVRPSNLWSVPAGFALIARFETGPEVTAVTRDPLTKTEDGLGSSYCDTLVEGESMPNAFLLTHDAKLSEITIRVG